MFLFNSTDPCKLKWVQVLHTDQNGGVISGRKRDLQQSVLHGRRIRFVLNNTYHNSAEFDTCAKVDADACCQSMPHVSVNNEDDFDPSGSWSFMMVCSTGHIQMKTYFVGGKAKSDKTIKTAIMWFALQKDKIRYQSPVYASGYKGNVAVKNIDALATNILQGFTVAISCLSNIFYTANCEVLPRKHPKPREISCEAIWVVGDYQYGNHNIFKNNAYWYFLILTSLDSLYQSRWYIGNNKFWYHNRGQYKMKWFVDDCWTTLHVSERNGSLSNTLMHLKIFADCGHSVKVKFDNTIMEAEGIRISGDHLSVFLVSSLSKRNAEYFREDLNWEFRVVSSTGTIRTYRPLVGASSVTHKTATIERKPVTWFVDTKKWDIVLHTLRNTSVVSGSILAVRYAIAHGAEIRIAFRFSNDSGFRIYKAHNMHLGPEHHVTAQVVRALKEYEVGNENFRLDDNPCWYFKLISTKGYVVSTEWTLKGVINHGQRSDKAEMKWFANL